MHGNRRVTFCCRLIPLKSLVIHLYGDGFDEMYAALMLEKMREGL